MTYMSPWHPAQTVWAASVRCQMGPQAHPLSLSTPVVLSTANHKQSVCSQLASPVPSPRG